MIVFATVAGKCNLPHLFRLRAFVPVATDQMIRGTRGDRQSTIGDNDKSAVPVLAGGRYLPLLQLAGCHNAPPHRVTLTCEATPAVPEGIGFQVQAVSTTTSRQQLRLRIRNDGLRFIRVSALIRTTIYGRGSGVVISADGLVLT